MLTVSKDKPRSVIFLHLPKTAGTTLNNIINRQYRDDEIYASGAIVQDSVAQLKAMEIGEREKIRIFIGHMGFGLHDLLAPPTTYFTILREPIDRVISFYYYVQRNGAHYLHDYVLNDDVSLDEFLTSKATLMTDNFQVRLISGVWNDIPYGECTRETLEQAKKNLQDSFAVVGLTEEFDQTLLLLKRALGWDNIYYMRHNVTKNRPQKDVLSPETMALLRSHNELDLELYAFAKTLFAEQVERQGASFARDVKLFQWKNGRFKPLINMYWQARKLSVRVFVREQIARLRGA